MMFRHALEVHHRRTSEVHHIGQRPIDSDVNVAAESDDLVETWKEVIRRMPSDLYSALREAMGMGSDEGMRRLEE